MRGSLLFLSVPIKKLLPNAKGEVRYRFVVDVGADPVTGKRKQVTRTSGTLREAKAEYARITNRRHDAALVPAHEITVNEWLDPWLAWKSEDQEESTVYSYTLTLDRVRGQLGQIRLQELTEDHVEAWMQWALREGRTRSGKAGTGLSVTSVEVNVALEVTIPRKVRKAERRTKALVQPWNVDEVHAFVRAIEDDRLCAPFLLSLMGLRPAEICGMRWADVDLERATLTIANTRTLMGNKIVVEKDSKSVAGERELPLPDLVRGALTRFHAVQMAESRAAGAR